MKPLKDCKWIVPIYQFYNNDYEWVATSCQQSNITELQSTNSYKTKKGAINNWKEFAKINGITNYKIKE